MQWSYCSAVSPDSQAVTARFGHSTVCINNGSVWGTELAVVFGGVSISGDTPAAQDQHAALAVVLVLQPEANTWFSPQVSGNAGQQGPVPDGEEPWAPEPRAFHCAAVVERRMYVFGGHVLSFDSEHNKKKRRFYNDLWCLDTVRRSGSGLGPGSEAGGVALQPGGGGSG